MLSVSLPYHELIGGTGLGSDAVLEAVRAAGAGSVELRAVFGNQPPEVVLQVAERIWRQGMRVSVHTAPRSAQTAAEDVFAPLTALLKAEKQADTILVLHPVPGQDLVAENRRMLDTLTAEARGKGYSVKLALENNRKMPDKSEGDSAGLVMQVVQETDPAYTGITFDMGHYAWATKSWEQSEVLLPPEAFLRRVIHTHIHALAGAERRYTTHFPLHRGTLPLGAYTEALRQCRYGGVLNLELEPERFADMLDGREAILESLNVLKAFDLA